MIVCPRCSKENQDHYKFCLGCGAELPRDAAQQPKSFTAPTPPAGFPAQPAPVAPAAASAAPGMGGRGAQFGGAAALGATVAAAPAGAAPAAAPAPAAPAPAAGGGLLTCPKCGTQNPPSFKFCGTCGHNMAEVAAAAAAAAGPAAASPAPAAAPAAPAGLARGSLVLIRPDGTEGDSFPLGEAETPIGRQGSPLFSGDTFLSPHHATFTFRGNDLEVRDEDSLNGIYLRVDREVPTELSDGSIFRIGQEIIRFEAVPAAEADANGTEAMGSPNPGFIGRICLIIGRDTVGNSYCIPREGLHLGRERGDVVFPEDGYVSGLHCRIHAEGGKIFLTDVGSSNGTFVRVSKTPVKSGNMLLMGQQLFRVEY